MTAAEQAYRQMERHFLSSQTVPAQKSLQTASEQKSLQTASAQNKKTAPRLIFVFSSPGAGKSTALKPRLNRLFADEKPVNLEIDELKTFIPAGEDVGRTTDMWFRRLVDKAIADRRSILIFRRRNLLLPNQTRHIYQKAKAAGYVTQASFVALDKERSRLGMVHRYEFALDNALRAQTLDRENYPRRPHYICHYIFYKVLPIALRACEASPEVDVVDVYDRQGTRLAWLDKRRNEQSPQSLVGAMRRERRRDWKAWEKNKFNRRVAEVKDKMKRRGLNCFEILKFKMLTSTSKSK